MASQLELRWHPKAEGPGRSFLPSDVCRDCPDIRKAIYVTSRAATAALQRQATTIVKIVRVIATGSYHFAVAVRRAKASGSRCEGLGNDRRQSQQSRTELGLLTRIAATESVTLSLRMKT